MAKSLLTGQTAVLYVTPVGGEKTRVGCVSDCSYTENFQVQKAYVLGHYGPVSIDVQGYDCQIQINGFIPNAKGGKTISDAANMYDSAEASSIFAFMPTKAEFMEDKGAYKLSDLWLETTAATPVEIAHFKDVAVAELNMKATQSGYMTGGCTLWARERVDS